MLWSRTRLGKVKGHLYSTLQLTKLFLHSFFLLILTTTCGTAIIILLISRTVLWVKEEKQSSRRIPEYKVEPGLSEPRPGIFLIFRKRQVGRQDRGPLRHSHHIIYHLSLLTQGTHLLARCSPLTPPIDPLTVVSALYFSIGCKQKQHEIIPSTAHSSSTAGPAPSKIAFDTPTEDILMI